MSNHPNIRKYLDVSTGNLPLVEAELIDENGIEGLIVDSTDYGHWVFVKDADDMGFIPEHLPVLARIMAFAREHDCRWICLDMDAEPLPDFLTFDW